VRVLAENRDGFSGVDRKTVKRTRGYGTEQLGGCYLRPLYVDRVRRSSERVRSSWSARLKYISVSRGALGKLDRRNDRARVDRQRIHSVIVEPFGERERERKKPFELAGVSIVRRNNIDSRINVVLFFRPQQILPVKWLSSTCLRI